MNPRHIISTENFPALAYKRYGSGPALMLIHGFPASGSLWDEMAPYLSQSLSVLVPDVPGTGDSRLKGGETSIEQLATIIPVILDDAGIDQCVVAGHSMGGYIALAAAELFPARLNGLSLIHSTALADDEEKKAKRSKSIALVRKGGREEFIKGMVPALFSESFKKAHPEVIKARVAEGLKLSEDSIVAFNKAMMARPQRLEVLRSAGFPVQWISGKEDTTIPWRNSLQQSSLPDVSFINLYDDCGHMGMLEQKDLMQVDLLKFVEHCLLRIEEGQQR